VLGLYILFDAFLWWHGSGANVLGLYILFDAFLWWHGSGANVSGVKLDDAGRVLGDTVRQYMYDLAIDNGISAVGYSYDDIPALVKATLPQVSTLN
jgi:hypothetical protein